ncbi:MAG: class I tRNA ligase family protein, partial [Candidatus Aenigmatarchaeota archaeon]
MISKNYDSKQCEEKWQKEWEKNRIYAFDESGKKKSFVIDTPPPFTSGVPHMGHVLWWTWNDIVARYKRMNGFNVLLPQGWDCHGLPTELRVEKEYKIRKSDKKFLGACDEWTTQCIKKMKDYMIKFGYSADWSYEYFTNSQEYVAFVQKTLVNLFNKNLIERIDHPVMWCTKCGTTLAKAEVGYVEMDGVLYYIKLSVKGSVGHIVIATTRPEMLPACVAVLVHPDDKRYFKFLNKKVILPIVDREVPVISNTDVDMTFGTGAVYLCTYGDEMDIKWQKKYDLPAFNIISKEGRMNESAGDSKGLKIMDARIRIMEQLGMLGLVEKEEKFKHNVLCHTERQACLNPIEFIPMKQWAIKVTEFSNDVLKMSDEIEWHPEHMKTRLKNWVDSMDWNWIFSRQRVYGTPIPFWYCDKCGKTFAPKKLPADPRHEEYHLKKCGCGGDIVGEKDICDGWIDSSITPLIVSGYWK